MKYRTLGKTGWKISEVSLGAWQIGGRWGSGFDAALGERIIHKAIEEGVNFIDTADVYSEGLSEQLVARVVKTRTERVIVATKIGRRLQPHVAEGYTPEHLTRFVEESLRNMGRDTIDLVQLHCPPSQVYDQAEVFGAMDELRQQGKIRHYGVSVETVNEALKAIQHPGVATVQIIFNLMRIKPAEEFFPAAIKANVGVIARVPLASGLLTGKFSSESTFEEGDHRHFNREGQAFDKGETFSGVPYEEGLKAVKEFKRLFGEEYLVQHALGWILMHDAVSTIIPGASSPEHVEGNVLASQLPPLPDIAMRDAAAVYEKFIRPHVHHLW